jgi:2,5-diketo-D-gluconate reductase A
VAIPKSVNSERIRENAGIFDFLLENDEMEQIGRLDLGQRFGPDPEVFQQDF